MIVLKVKFTSNVNGVTEEKADSGNAEWFPTRYSRFVTRGT